MNTWDAGVKQAGITALITAAAAASLSLPWLPVTNQPWLVGSAAMSLVLLVVSVAMVRWQWLRRFEIAVPLGDFIAVGALRYATGDTQSVFLAIVILPVIWIAAGSGRWRILLPLAGVCSTLILPVVIDASYELSPNELVRLVIAVLVYAAAAAVVNELYRQLDLQLRASHRRRRAAEAEVAQAATVQQSLQPASGEEATGTYTLAGACVPARTVGGDFYDWYTTADGDVAITLGDVMGKGVGAGMIAAAVRAVIRSSAKNPDPATAFELAATGLTSEDGEHFTTCFHARLSFDGTLRWVDAGHSLTVLLHEDRTTTLLRSSHLPLGVGSEWRSSETALRSGDTLVSISDGVLDLFGGAADSFNRYMAFLGSQENPARIVQAIVDLAAGQERLDDVTVLVVGQLPVEVVLP